MQESSQKEGSKALLVFATLLLHFVSPIASVYGDTEDPSVMSRRSYYLFHTTQQ